ncbi:class I SAM-dependent methyltransferase [Dehalococcoidia bacterium]|nr:class I SAM-dependent methyltransferase [Dehalococcoidia bacterium]
MRESKSVLQQNIELHKHKAYFYDAIHPEIFNIFEQRRLRRELRKLKGEVNPLLPVLDIGSGTGNLVHHLQHLGLNVVASDLSAEMLKENPARHKVVCDAGHLPFKDSCFGAITTYAVFHHLPEIRSALKEICRVAAGSCILYFDHDPFVPTTEKQKGRYPFTLVDLAGWLIWLLLHPKYWKRLVEYAVHGRKKHLQNLKELTQAESDEVLDMDSILKTLKEHQFQVYLHNYGNSTLLKCRRMLNRE